MFKWANILSTSRNQAQSLAHHHRLGTWQWHTAHMPFYCTAPPTRRAGLLEYHRIATIAAALVSLQNHFFTSTPHPHQSVQLNPTQLHAAERSGWQQEQNSHFRYFSPVQPARSASPNQPRGGGDEEGGRPRRGRREIRWFSDCSGQQCY